MKQAEYGFWKSSITVDRIVEGSLRLGDVALSDGHVYWTEQRPDQGGRSVLVRQGPNGSIEELSPEPLNVRTRVHEYGGGAFWLGRGEAFFSNDSDGRIFRLRAGGVAEPLTAGGPYRYADGVVDEARQQILCVREDHSDPNAEAANTLIAVDSQTGAETIVAQGADFYSSPRLDPSGDRLAWIEWRHPNMPWDGTELKLARATAAGGWEDLGPAAGGPSESCMMPSWSPDGTLYFVSDRNGWWNLHRVVQDGVESVAERDAEFGYPHWVFGLSTYAFETAETAYCTYRTSDGWKLARLRFPEGNLEDVECPYTEIGALHAEPGRVVFKGGSPSEPGALIALDTRSGEYAVLRRTVEIDDSLRSYFSAAVPLELPAEDGATTHAYFYQPRNPDFEAPADSKPPLIVIGHGGPTGQSEATLNLKIQFWTSRGFAVVDVNYGGSSGYGREYRERLAGRWGVVDVDDCCQAARFLAAEGKADPKRLIIRGGSAGGYTTLAALAFRDVFAAGASYYGIGDLGALADDTHKFESRYLDKLVGKYPEHKAIYQERSPAFHAEGLSVPVIFFQGAEDRVVPLEQAERMVAILRDKGLPVNYLLFEGEQHGFRQSENIKRALEAELFFYSTVLLEKGVRF